MQSILPQVIPLLQYLNNLSDAKLKCSSACVSYLASLFILPEMSSPSHLEIPPSEERISMRDILNRFIASNLRKNLRVKNLLCYGYRYMNSSSKANSGIRHVQNVECYHVNTLHQYFDGAHWQEIANVYGETVLHHILSLPCFLNTGPPSDNYTQICGPPIHQLQHAEVKDRLKVLPRNKILYHAPSRFRVGLPHFHVLNQPSVSADSLYDHIFQKITEKIPSDTESSLKLLCKGIIQGYVSSLPLFDAMSCFTLPQPSNDIRRSTDGLESNLSSLKRRRRGSRGGRRRKRFKRSPDNRNQAAARLMSSQAMQLMDRDYLLAKSILAQPSRQLHSQNSMSESPDMSDLINPSSLGKVPLASVGKLGDVHDAHDDGTKEIPFLKPQPPQPPHLLSNPVMMHNADPINFANLCSPVDKVSHFIKAICRRVFSKHLIWSTRHNLNVFMNSIECYIRRNRGEGMTLHESRHKLHVSRMNWLSRCQPNNLQLPLLDALLHWIFADFINSILRNSFYITEVEGKSNQIHYYRRAAWDQISQQGLLQLSSQFQALPRPQNNSTLK